jgi:hypothetical protein
MDCKKCNCMKNKIKFKTTQTVKLNTKVQVNIILENSS